MDKDNIDDEKDFFEQMPKEVRIIPFQIAPNLMVDFQKRIQNLNGQPISKDLLEEDFAAIEELDIFKEKLVTAAFIGTVKGFRKLEALEKKITDPERHDWVRLSALYARMIMEQDLLDDPISFIVSGLGGEGVRIRYSFVLFADQTITGGLARLVAAELEELVPYYDIIWEKNLEHTPKHISFTILVPYNKSPTELIEAGLEKLTFLSKEYMESNIKIPTEEDIIKWLDNKEKKA